MRSVAQVLEEEIPPNATAYRFGGDEFLVLIRYRFDCNEIQNDINEILRRLNSLTTVTCSIGGVRYPEDGTTVESLMIKVDIALHNAKLGGKDRHYFFEESMATTFTERIQVENIITEAVKTEGFYLVYQPVVKSKTGKIASFEALVRLQEHAISPSLFIPIAEELDIILPLGYWVIKEAMIQVAKWQKAGRAKPISLNLSVNQFYDENLYEFLVEQIKETGVEPAFLEFEISEEVMLGCAEEAIEVMHKIKSLGIYLLLDNYGTGYSFVNYMAQLPVDGLKIHGTLTENVLNNPDVMKGLISIAHGLGMQVVAEQVETKEEARLLREVNCDYLQGFLFSKPVLPNQAELLLEADYGEKIGLA